MILNSIFRVLIFSLFTINIFAAELSPVGVWMVSSEDAKVEIYQKDDHLEGKIIWLKEPLETNGKEKTDINNPDEKLRSQLIMNMIFLKDFKKDSNENKWSGGTIYDAKSGKTYKAWMKPEGENKLYLRGYVGFSFLGRTEEWKRQ